MKNRISLKKIQNGILFLSVMSLSLSACSKEDTPVPPENKAPTANAGADQTITVNTVTLNGSGTDVDGTIKSYEWLRIDGPTQYSIAAPTQAQTAVNNLTQGTYQFVLIVTDNLGAKVRDTVTVIVNPKVWTLVFEDNFNATGNFDTSKWSYCSRNNASWAKYLTSTSDYASLDGSNLLLKMDNKTISNDAVPYHSGGIETNGKVAFTYGKVEVRAKFTQGQGSWPAIWMMPATPNAYGSWPNSGEIDIMEHVNNENVIHQTVHNGAVTNSSGVSSVTKSSSYIASDYNTYGIIWQENKIEFYLNGVLTSTYNKPANATSAQWPFDKPFYLILNQSGGAGWPGPITDSNLPFQMQVDWVRISQ
ncbi:glycoside hydrolase family 16 protein [Flavobacterium sp. GT3P67]|uniref:glycoside hydrolase family 16 protein n=1 Tax=Flavobacterium sp. GT3P67 TaxID=2541722 RepID=UPI00104D3AA6|nr:glycoside hydrolase family 16 protein [Flavobacterium sp. GT3P67]TDE55404.1 glycosyl hydrolase family protein [Flavobacterium sp. GT3P67]